MSTTQTSEGYNGIYLERSGMSSYNLAECLVAQPEFLLDETEKQEAYDFERMLYNYELSDGLTVERLIKSHKGESVMAPRFFAEAFLNGGVDTPASLSDIPSFTTTTEVYSWLATAASNSSIDGEAFRTMAGQSTEYYLQTTANALISETDLDVHASDVMRIAIDPQKSMKFAVDTAEARAFLLNLRKEYKEGGDKLDGAKRALIDVYLGKINTLVADDITVLDSLINQAELIGDQDLRTSAEELVPKGLREAINSNDVRDTVFKRLDYLRNGMGNDKNGRATAIDHEVIDGSEQLQEEPSPEESLFTTDELAKMKAFTLQPDQMADVFRRILARVHLLSAEPSSTWTPMRGERAADGLFQVVVQPKKNTFEVMGKSGVYFVAASGRSLFDVLVVGGFHELEHINQVQADLEIGKTIHIATLKGRRVSMLRESGANFKQRQAEKELFGASKPVALTYARALQVLEAGGTAFDATRAFYNEKRRVMPEVTPDLAAQEAADRVLRITSGGGFNSQPMAYAEEIILNHELRGASREVKERAIAITSLDLVDQVRLHRYGLLPEMKNDSIDWKEIILEELAPYIEQALQEN